MTDTTSIPLRQLSAREHAGMQAQISLRGPKNITWPEVEGGSSFYGWSVLSLEIITAKLPSSVESRSVYANLYDEDQQFAVLRAVYWDWEIARQTIQEQEESFQQIIPARFIKLPITQLKEWLFVFTNMSAIIDGPCIADSEMPVRGLRIERDYTACIFEKVWQVEDTDHTALNQKWNQIWQQMTEALTTGLVVTRLREDFWLMKSEITYDFQAYQPNRFDFSM